MIYLEMIVHLPHRFIFSFFPPRLFIVPSPLFMFAGCAFSVVWCGMLGFLVAVGFSLQGESGERGSNNPGRDKRRNGVPDLQRHSPKKVTILSDCWATELTDCCTYSYLKRLYCCVVRFVLLICWLLLCMPQDYFFSRTYFTLQYEYRVCYYCVRIYLVFFPSCF